MIIGNSAAIQAKNGHVLKVIRIARISTPNQDELSLEDQLALLEQYVKWMYDGPVEYSDLATQGSGEELDREELKQLEELIETGRYDLVICEDLGRICRRLHAIIICELCEDSDTRLIAINDRVDTSDEGWRDGAFISSWHHERSNKDTSNRIKRSLRNRFLNGAILVDPGPLYVVPEHAKHIDDVSKNPEAIELVEKIISMLEQGSCYSEIADWLNEIHFPVGGQSKKSQWNGKLLKERFLDTRLKGVEEWNNKKSVRNNKSGSRRSKDAETEEILRRKVPHLAYIKVERFDRLKKLLTEKNKRSRRTDERSSDPLRRKAKKRTPFPGQSLNCGICGRMFVFGGHGQKQHLMCDGARQYHCWNGITVDGPLAAQKISEAILNEYESLPEFDHCFLKLVNEEADKADKFRQNELSLLKQDLRKCEREIENYLQFIATGSSNAVREKLATVENLRLELLKKVQALESTPSDRIEIPSVEELKSLAFDELKKGISFSWEFNKALRRIIPKIVVFPYRLIDGGRIVFRAKFHVQLGGLLTNQRTNESLKIPLTRELTVDLFNPPQREAYRNEVTSLREFLIEKDVAKQLGITITAASRAYSLQKKMDDLGVVDPYQPVTEPPEDFTKLRRHHHKRYDFQPLPDTGKY